VLIRVLETAHQPDPNAPNTPRIWVQVAYKRV
jgi:hypothetical protein